MKPVCEAAQTNFRNGTTIGKATQTVNFSLKESEATIHLILPDPGDAMLLTRRKPASNDDYPFDIVDAGIGDGAKPVLPPLRTILLVDDDDALREVMEACLGMMGYGVIPCPDAYSASHAFRSSQIDILLTDLQMPGRSGVELARELTALNPALPVVIVSGSLLTDELSSEIQRRNWRFRPKPCRLPELTTDIQSLLTFRHEYAA